MSTGEVCKRCGHVHTKCKAHRRRQAGSNGPLHPCGGQPRRGKRVCRLHGGDSPSGIASPHFKHGKDSRYIHVLPQELARHFDATDPRLVELSEEIAILKAGVASMLSRMQEAKRVSPAMRKELFDLTERVSRIVAAESRRRKDEHEMVSRDEFGRFAKAVLMAVASHVLDAPTRGKIQEDVMRMLAISQVSLVTAEAV